METFHREYGIEYQYWQLNRYIKVIIPLSIIWKNYVLHKKERGGRGDERKYKSYSREIEREEE